jgi:BlaI family transcriptional regulator, penicillinase repressor
MSQSTSHVTGAELKILQVLWEDGRVGARQITESIYGAASASHVATVQKLLQRLEAKGFVQRDRSGHIHTFEATISFTAFAGGQLEQLAQRLTEGSLVPFITHLVQAQKLSPKERDEIRRLLDTSSQQKPRGHK